MFVYFSLALMVPVLSWAFRKKENRNDLVLLILCCVMFILLCLRNPFGFFDLPAYRDNFYETKNFSFLEMLRGTRFINTHVSIHEENGYLWLNWILSHMGANFNVLLCVHAAVVCTSLFFFIRKYSADPVFSIYFFLCIGGLTDHTYILRQSFAFAILLFAVPFIVERKPLRFLLLVILAASFHRTALSFILIYLLSYVKLNRKTAFIGIGTALSMIILVPLLYSTVILKLMQAFGKSGYKIAQFDFREMLIIITAMLFFVIFITDFSKDIPLSDTVMFWITVISLMFMAVSSHIYIMARVGMSMYLPFAMIMLPNFIEKNENRELMSKFKIAIYAALFAYLIFIVITTPYSFSFVWDKAAII